MLYNGFQVVYIVDVSVSDSIFSACALPPASFINQFLFTLRAGAESARLNSGVVWIVRVGGAACLRGQENTEMKLSFYSVSMNFVEDWIVVA